jgi:hypothetical protein
LAFPHDVGFPVSDDVENWVKRVLQSDDPNGQAQWQHWMQQLLCGLETIF